MSVGYSLSAEIYTLKGRSRPQSDCKTARALFDKVYADFEFIGYDPTCEPNSSRTPADVDRWMLSRGSVGVDALQ